MAVYSFAASGLSSLLAFRVSGRYGQGLLGWMAVMLGTCAIVLTLQQLNGVAPTYQQLTDDLNQVLAGLWLLPFAASAVYLVFLPFLVMRFPSRWRGLLLGYAVTFLNARLWLLLICTSWLLLLDNLLSETQAKVLRTEVTQSLRLLSLFWFDVAIIALAVGASAVRHWLSSQNDHRAGFPRLIVPSTILYLPLMQSVLAAWVITSYGFLRGDCTSGVCLSFTSGTAVIVENAWWLLAVGGLAISYFYGSFKVAIDVINYFDGQPIHRAVNPIQTIAQAVNFEVDGKGSLRHRLRDRLSMLRADLSARLGPFPQTTTLAHSLGSMIAIDLYCKSGKGNGSSHGIGRLVTMGSPYLNIFQYYFPHLFTPLKSSEVGRVTEFVNIYRNNDYVGTKVAETSVGVRDEEEPPKGHFGYFRDPAVVGIGLGKIGADRQSTQDLAVQP